MLWPGDRRFVFTIFDDTDYATLDNVGEVYRFLADLGFRTTKSVWPLRGTQPGNCPGQTCEDPDHLNWLLKLRDQGFEIGYHMSTWHTSERERTIAALALFEKLFGQPPSSMANHSNCGENIYWGAARLSGFAQIAYNLATHFRFASRFRDISKETRFFGEISARRRSDIVATLCSITLTRWRSVRSCHITIRRARMSITGSHHRKGTT